MAVRTAHYGIAPCAVRTARDFHDVSVIVVALKRMVRRHMTVQTSRAGQYCGHIEERAYAALPLRVLSKQAHGRNEDRNRHGRDLHCAAPRISAAALWIARRMRT